MKLEPAGQLLLLRLHLLRLRLLRLDPLLVEQAQLLRLLLRLCLLQMVVQLALLPRLQPLHLLLQPLLLRQACLLWLGQQHRAQLLSGRARRQRQGHRVVGRQTGGRSLRQWGMPHGCPTAAHRQVLP